MRQTRERSKKINRKRERKVIVEKQKKEKEEKDRGKDKEDKEREGRILVGEKQQKEGKCGEEAYSVWRAH